MRYLKEIKAMYCSAEEAQSRLSGSRSVLLFLVGDGNRPLAGDGNSHEFSYYINFTLTDEFSPSVPIITGFYNGTFGAMNLNLEGGSFTQKHFLEDALSNQMVIYLIQELVHFPNEDKSYLESLMISLGDYLVKKICEKDTIRFGQTGLTPFQLKRIDCFINDNIDRPLSTKDLAGVAGQSIHHFIRMFKRSTGETPHQYLTKLKLEQAKRLLIQSEENIIQVGLGVGFNNPSHFSQLFKNSFGIPPLQFRKTFRSTQVVLN